MMYVVEYCPDNLFKPGAMFTRANFDYTLEMGCWPEGIIFAGRGRRIIIQNGQAVELKDGSLSKAGQEPEIHSPNKTAPSV